MKRKLEHPRLEILRNNQEKYCFLLKNKEGELIFKSILFESLQDCNSAILLLKTAVANSHLNTIYD